MDMTDATLEMLLKITTYQPINYLENWMRSKGEDNTAVC